MGISGYLNSKYHLFSSSIMQLKFVDVKYLAITLIVHFSIISCGELEMHEASMNFDLENVSPFLNRLQENILPSLPVEQLVKLTESIEVEREESLTIEINWEGADVELQYSVHMDDVDAADVYFFSSAETLVQAISSEMISFAEKLGI